VVVPEKPRLSLKITQAVYLAWISEIQQINGITIIVSMMALSSDGTVCNISSSKLVKKK
jgi:hypothetical protein